MQLVINLIEPLKKLGGFQRSSYGVEWLILRKIHFITLLGTLLPMGFLGVVYLGFNVNAHDFKLLAFFIISLIILHWTFMMVIGIACLIIVLMKGPAYVADAYHLPDAGDHDDLKQLLL